MTRLVKGWCDNPCIVRLFCGRTNENVMKINGPWTPGRNDLPHCFSTVCLTERVKVTSCVFSYLIFAYAQVHPA